MEHSKTAVPHPPRLESRPSDDSIHVDILTVEEKNALLAPSAEETALNALQLLKASTNEMEIIVHEFSAALEVNVKG